MTDIQEPITEEKEIVPAEQVATNTLNEYWEFLIKELQAKAAQSLINSKTRAFKEVIETVKQHKSNWNISYKQLLAGEPNNFVKAESE